MITEERGSPWGLSWRRIGTGGRLCEGIGAGRDWAVETGRC